MFKRTFLRGGAALAGAALTPAVGHASALSIRVEGSDEFQAAVTEAIGLLASIGLTRYITSMSDVVVEALELPAGSHPAMTGWVYLPENRGPIRADRVPIYLLGSAVAKAPSWAVASYLAHEATHLLQFRRDPEMGTDENGPTAVQLAVESALTN